VTAAKVSLVNRVSHVYEAETAIRLVLIDGNDALNLDTPAQMTGLNGPLRRRGLLHHGPGDECAGGTLARVRQVIGLLAGASNFDVGHMALGLNAGGMSSIAVVGGNNKAMGCTGIATPVGDLFAVGPRRARAGPPVLGQPLLQRDPRDLRPPSATPQRRGARERVVDHGASRDVQGGRPPGAFRSVLVAAELRRDHELRRLRGGRTSTTSSSGVLTGFDGMDSFQIRYNGNDSAVIMRGQ
jgi:hypothetical protein